MTDRLQACSDDFKDEELHEVWIQLMAAALSGTILASETNEGKEVEALQMEEATVSLVRGGPYTCHEMLELIFRLEPHLVARVTFLHRKLNHESN